MEFTAGAPKVDDRECVAYLTHMEYEPSQQCLVVKVQCGNCVWLYYDGDIQLGDWQPDDPDITQKFYKGDSVTITF